MDDSIFEDTLGLILCFTLEEGSFFCVFCRFDLSVKSLMAYDIDTKNMTLIGTHLRLHA